MTQHILFFGLILLAAAITGCGRTKGADLIVTNAIIWTGNDAQPTAEALAVSGDTIIAVGSNEDILRHLGDETRLIEAQGRMLTPGFIDSHVHFLTGGFRLSSVQLRDADREQFVQRIAAYAKTLRPGEWIDGGDWDHTNWGGELPDRNWIDAVTPENPVFISRLDGHMALANTAALNAAGIEQSVADVDGGEIIRDKTGRLTGVLKDNAMDLVFAKMPNPSDEQKLRALNAAMNYVASNGVTSVQNMGDGLGEMAIFERVHAENGLITRIYQAMPIARWQKLPEKIAADGRGDKWLKIGGLKGFMDGSLGSHTAAFFEPFSDTPDESGFLVNDETDMYRWIHTADSAGLQLMIHAIGDRAIHLLLNIFERVENENGPRDRRFRIEHAQHIAPADIPRFAKLGVIASMQPYHAIDDGRWAETVIGAERIKTTYAFRSLLDANARLAFGSDWFVAPPTPLEGIYAAVTRRTLDDANPDGWVPEQKITVEETLKAYTADAAYASFDEQIKGTLELGKLADFVLLEKDIRSIPPEEIRNVAVDMTVVGGKIVFEKQ